MEKYNRRYFTDTRRVAVLFETGLKAAHSHDFIEIVYFDKGTGYHNVDGEDYPVKAGDLFVLKRGVSHYYYADSPRADNPLGDLVSHCCIFDESLFPELRLEDENDFLRVFVKEYMGYDLADRQSFYRAENDPIYSFKPALVKMFRELQSHNRGYIAIMKTCVIEILIMTLRKTVFGIRQTKLDSHEAMVESIEKYVQENLGGELQLSDLSNTFFYSVSHLNRIFKEKKGVTISQYANARRLAVVGGLLKTTDKSIEEIMEEVGYNDKKRFYETFKRQYHCTPGEFRKLFCTRE